MVNFVRSVRHLQEMTCYDRHGIKIGLHIDSRDKLQQGLEEARKMAAAHPEWVVPLYDADVIEGVFVASMQLVEGETLRSYLAQAPAKRDLWGIASLYVNGIGTSVEAIASLNSLSDVNVIAIGQILLIAVENAVDSGDPVNATGERS